MSIGEHVTGRAIAFGRPGDPCPLTGPIAPLYPGFMHGPPGSGRCRRSSSQPAGKPEWNTMGRESKLSVPQGRSDSFPIRSRLVPGLADGTGIKNFRPARTLRFVPYSFPVSSWACRTESEGWSENLGVRHHRTLFNPHFRRFLRRRNAGIPAKWGLERACDSKRDSPDVTEWRMPAIQIYRDAPVNRYAGNRWLT